MGREPDILVGLDLGTKKITVTVAEVSEENPEEAQIISVGQAPSRGFIKGMISNLKEATASISEAVADAETALSDINITNVVVAFNCPGMMSCHTRGRIELGETSRQIVREDLQEVIGAALSRIKIPENAAVIHTIPVKFAIDGNGGVANPIDMIGMTLEVEMTVLLVPTSIPKNVVNSVQLVPGLKVSGLVLKPIVESLGAMTQDERDRGVSLVALGGGTTSFSVFSEGKLMYAREVPIGGDYISNDIKQVLKIPYVFAEKVKKGVSVKPDERPTGIDVVEIQGSRFEIDKEEVANTAADRLSEVFTDFIFPTLEKMKDAGYNTEVVLTGGVAQTPGIKELAEQCLQTDVSVSAPVLSAQMPDGRNTCAYSAAAGLIMYQMERRRNPLAFINPPVKDFTEFKTIKKIDIVIPPRRSTSTGHKITLAIKKLAKELF